MARGAALAEAVARLEERFGDGVVVAGGEYPERRALRSIPFGIASLDALLDGGVVAGEPTALVGDTGAGMLTLALFLTASAQAAGGEIVWLDPSGSFDALAAARAGVDLSRLLVVRASDEDLAFAASVVARSSAFTLVVVDLGGPLARGADAALPTVVARARAARVPLLVLADRVPARAALSVVEVRRREWLREGARLVGWRSDASRPHDRRSASLAFVPLALPPRLVVDEGVHELRVEALA